MGHDAISTDLQHYLRQSREGLLRALDGLGEYDVRKPMTPSGTNLLGLVKHLTDVEASYLGACIGRPAPVTLPWVEDGSIWDGADMWARSDESRDYLVGLYRAAAAHSDASIEEVDLGAPAYVDWWREGRRETTFGHLLVRVVAETAQHAGHADILRESIDGRGGRDHDDVGDDAYWVAYLAKIQSAADAFR
ncbi:DinB family protein [Solicola gregarius]|uniref:DinB family protein n=1 Tax=Solicola gregarius TaxID=2908642 RepID=A0AA46TH71_9ACTN|nr:DinB family protein [Solicola gregarius]UYM05091.1 DinB family protein [Solicola gregarius]